MKVVSSWPDYSRMEIIAVTERGRSLRPADATAGCLGDGRTMATVVRPDHTDGSPQLSRITESRIVIL